MVQLESKVVVVGVDFSRASDDALLEALGLLRDGTASMVHVVHVLAPREATNDQIGPATLHAEQEVVARTPAILRERIEQLAAQLKVPLACGRVRTHARVGREAETLLQVAVDYEADLLIVGTHGRREGRRTVLGSVAEWLLRTARCPLLVARSKDYTGFAKTAHSDESIEHAGAPRHRTPSDVSEQAEGERDSWRPSDPGPAGSRTA